MLFCCCCFLGWLIKNMILPNHSALNAFSSGKLTNQCPPPSPPPPTKNTHQMLSLQPFSPLHHSRFGPIYNLKQRIVSQYKLMIRTEYLLNCAIAGCFLETFPCEISSTLIALLCNLLKNNLLRDKTIEMH